MHYYLGKSQVRKLDEAQAPVDLVRPMARLGLVDTNVGIVLSPPHTDDVVGLCRPTQLPWRRGGRCRRTPWRGPWFCARPMSSATPSTTTRSGGRVSTS